MQQDFGTTLIANLPAILGALATLVGAVAAAYHKGLHTPVPEPKKKDEDC
jgi:hypothetical protein